MELKQRMNMLRSAFVVGLSVLGGTPALASEERYVFKPQNGEPVEAIRGELLVPENRDDAESRQIKLAYVRFPATTDNPGAPIVYLAGGPGGSGVTTARGPRFPLFMALREVADVIAFDQRGTGWSNDISQCKTEHRIPLNRAMTPESASAIMRAAAKDCLDVWADAGVDISGYNTVESARDLDALRAHLGVRKIGLWGISYGSHLAFAAMEQMPERIERVVLASAEGLDQTVKLPARTDAYFGRVQAAINRDARAAQVYPDIKALLRRVFARLDAEPAAIEVKGADGSVRSMKFGKFEAQLLTGRAISDPVNLRFLLPIFAAADAGDFGPLRQVVRQFVPKDEIVKFRGMPEAMDIASGISEARLALVNKQAKTSLLGDALNFPMPHLVGAFGNLDLGDDFRASFSSDIPTLLFSGTLDGRTYVESQKETIAGFSAATQVIVENAGHNLFMSSPEVRKRIVAFMKGETISGDPIQIELPDFAPAE